MCQSPNSVGYSGAIIWSMRQRSPVRMPVSPSAATGRVQPSPASSLTREDPGRCLNCKPCQVTRHGAHYVSTSPTKLAQAYKDADYFSRNVRAIEVLVDRQGIVQGKAPIKNGYFLPQVGPIIRFSQIFTQMMSN